MDKRDRLRRVVLLCAHFSRNLAYFRATRSRMKDMSSQFWITINANFLDMAVIDWCKLFGDPNENHHWKKVVTNQDRFVVDLVEHVGTSADQFASYVDEMRTYRDKFLAHLDDRNKMIPPFLDQARAAIDFYHRYVVDELASFDLSDDLPTDLSDYYRHCFDEANAIYKS